MLNNLLESFFSPSQIVIICVVAVIGVALIVVNVVLAYVFHKRGERKLYDRLLQQQRDELMKQLEDMHNRKFSEAEQTAYLQQNFFAPPPSAAKVNRSEPVSGSSEPKPVRAAVKTVPRKEQPSVITAEDVSAKMSDEEASSLIQTKTVKRTKVGAGNGAAISVGKLSEYFGAGALVNLTVLKNKHLISKDAGYLTILAEGCLNKPLTVEADEFSVEAVKMIILSGGKVIQRKITG